MSNLHYKKNNIEEQKGFSLIESLISITILMISVAVPMTMAWSGLLAAYLAEDQIVAYYLAQDAIEYVRNKRDYNKLESTTNMLDDIFTNCKVSDPNGSGTYEIDNSTDVGCSISTFGPITSDSDAIVFNNDKLYYHPAGGEYNYNASNGTLTKFSRQVRIGYINEGLSEMIVEVVVRWNSSTGTEQQYKLRSYLTDW